MMFSDRDRHARSDGGFYRHGLRLGTLSAAQELASGQPLCKGFAVGRSVFQSPAEQWFAGTIDDNDVIEQVGANYSRLIQLWVQRHH